ncbi:MAG TPA: bifunctional diguanylate cyclase/phosphodiesterase [Acidimicrobiales bacterium]|nr:bifunctional diguanylate cyclase/phosphodiesterase [Acidimicrobiales bacterium]
MPVGVVTRRENSPGTDSSSPGAGASSRTRRHLVVAGVWAALIALTLYKPSTEIAVGLASFGTIGAYVFGIHHYRPERRALWWMALGAFILFVVGGGARDELHTLGVLTVHRSLIPDLIVLPGYALLGAALIGMIRARTGSMHHRLGIIYDGVIASLAVLACSLVYVIEPVLSRRGVPMDVKLIITCYPAVSLFMLVIMLQIAFGTGSQHSTAERFLIAALLSMFVGDAVYLFADIRLLNVPGNLLDLPYVIAFAGAASCALDPSMRNLTERASEPSPRWTPGRIALVGVAFFVPAILVLQQRHYVTSERLALFATIVALTTTGILQIVQAVRSAELSEARLLHQSLHDELTGLPNRHSMELHLRRMVKKSAPNRAPVGLLFFDLDRFKLINDTLGPTHGDEFLIQVARRLCENTRAGDLVSRIGSDEFVVVLGGSVGISEARAFANRLRASLRAPFLIAGSEFFVTASIGIAFVTPDYSFDPEVLLRDADTAMHQAKEAGRDAVAVYDNTMRQHLTERVEMERDLRRAVEHRQLHLVFQPIVRMNRNEVLGFEALVRWAHPNLGVLLPKRFVPLAEENDLICEIGSWVLDDALRQLTVCRAVPGLEHLTVAVNLSALQLKDELLVQRVGRSLAVHGIPGSALTLELTESEMMDDPEVSIAALTALRRLGVLIAVDDFGTKYSSLAYLQRLPVNILKIDQSFVADMNGAEAAPSGSLVAAIIAMSQALGIQTIVEGVETAEQARNLANLGCKVAQGYFYARPVRADQLIDVIGLLTRSQPYGATEEKQPVVPVQLSSKLQPAKDQTSRRPSA